jgi:hypothetical protein
MSHRGRSSKGVAARCSQWRHDAGYRKHLLHVRLALAIYVAQDSRGLRVGHERHQARRIANKSYRAGRQSCATAHRGRISRVGSICRIEQASLPALAALREAIQGIAHSSGTPGDAGGQRSLLAIERRIEVALRERSRLETWVRVAISSVLAPANRAGGTGNEACSGRSCSEASWQGCARCALLALITACLPFIGAGFLAMVPFGTL